MLRTPLRCVTPTPGLRLVRGRFLLREISVRAASSPPPSPPRKTVEVAYVDGVLSVWGKDTYLFKDTKDGLKARGYKWNLDAKRWSKKVTREKLRTEVEALEACVEISGDPQLNPFSQAWPVDVVLTPEVQACLAGSLTATTPAKPAALTRFPDNSPATTTLSSHFHIGVFACSLSGGTVSACSFDVRLLLAGPSTSEEERQQILHSARTGLQRFLNVDVAVDDGVKMRMLIFLPASEPVPTISTFTAKEYEVDPGQRLVLPSDFKNPSFQSLAKISFSGKYAIGDTVGDFEVHEVKSGTVVFTKPGEARSFGSASRPILAQTLYTATLTGGFLDVSSKIDLSSENCLTQIAVKAGLKVRAPYKKSYGGFIIIRLDGTIDDPDDFGRGATTLRKYWFSNPCFPQYAEVVNAEPHGAPAVLVRRLSSNNRFGQELRNPLRLLFPAIQIEDLSGKDADDFYRLSHKNQATRCAEALAIRNILCPAGILNDVFSFNIGVCTTFVDAQNPAKFSYAGDVVVSVNGQLEPISRVNAAVFMNGQSGLALLPPLAELDKVQQLVYFSPRSTASANTANRDAVANGVAGYLNVFYDKKLPVSFEVYNDADLVLAADDLRVKVSKLVMTGTLALLELPSFPSVDETYSDLKMCTDVFAKQDITTQFLTSATAQKASNVFINQNLALGVNAHLGGQPFLLKGLSPGTIFIGMDVARNANSVATPCSVTLLGDDSRFLSSFRASKHKLQRGELLPPEFFDDLLKQLDATLLENVKECNRLVFHRDGRVTAKELVHMKDAVWRFNQRRSQRAVSDGQSAVCPVSLDVVSVVKDVGLCGRIGRYNADKPEHGFASDSLIDAGEILLVTTGTAKKLPGTSRPIRLKLVDSSSGTPLAQIVKEVFLLSCVPVACTALNRLPNSTGGAHKLGKWTSNFPPEFAAEVF